MTAFQRLFYRTHLLLLLDDLARGRFDARVEGFAARLYGEGQFDVLARTNDPLFANAWLASMGLPAEDAPRFDPRRGELRARCTLSDPQRGSVVLFALFGLNLYM